MPGIFPTEMEGCHIFIIWVWQWWHCVDPQCGKVGSWDPGVQWSKKSENCWVDKIFITRWWQLKYLLFLTWGRWTYFDSYFSSGLKKPPISKDSVIQITTSDVTPVNAILVHREILPMADHIRNIKVGEAVLLYNSNFRYVSPWSWHSFAKSTMDICDAGCRRYETSWNITVKWYQRLSKS